MDATNASIAMVIPLVGYILAWAYPFYINVWNKELMDTHRRTEVGIQPEENYDKSKELAEAAHVEEYPHSRGHSGAK